MSSLSSSTVAVPTTDPDVSDVAFDALEETLAWCDQNPAPCSKRTSYVLVNEFLRVAKQVSAANEHKSRSQRASAMRTHITSWLNDCVRASGGVLMLIEYALAYLLAYHLTVKSSKNAVMFAPLVRQFWAGLVEDEYDKETNKMGKEQMLFGYGMAALVSLRDKMRDTRDSEPGNLDARVNWLRAQSMLQAAELSVQNHLENRLLVELTHKMTQGPITDLCTQLSAQAWMHEGDFDVRASCAKSHEAQLRILDRFMVIKHAQLRATLLPILATPARDAKTGQRNPIALWDPVATLVPYIIHNYNELSQAQVDALHAWTQLKRVSMQVDHAGLKTASHETL